MMRDEPIAVFAYAFPHRKTQDFLIETALAGYRNVTVIAAPWKKLAHADSDSYFPTAIRNAAPVDPRAICERLGFDFHELEHSDVDAVTALRDRAGFKLGVVSGARILNRAIIDLFDEGILNIHPGKIPETSGLDLFYYTIKNRVAMGVTAHYIDARVDAGEILFFEETPLSIEATPEIVQHNNYHSQIRALRRFFALRDADELTREPANRPFKNQPMTGDEKRRYIGEFPEWLEQQVSKQNGRKLHEACRLGNIPAIEALLDAYPDLIEARSVEGWTPLIVACYHHQIDAVQTLLELGANSNTGGGKGTTPLMYAKSAYLDGAAETNVDYALLSLLLDAGADVSQCDTYGKDIFHYLAELGDEKISSWLKQPKENS